MDSKKVGSFIAELRKEKGLTQLQLADMLNVTDKAISRWETGKGYPDIELLQKIAVTLGVSLNELLDGERAPDGKIDEVCERNVTEAYTTVKVTRKKSKVLLAVCLVLILCLGITFSLCYMYSASPDANYHLISNGTDTDSVVTQITDFLSEKGYLRMETVCTYMDLNFPEKDNPSHIFSGEIKLHCRDMHRDITICIHYDDDYESTVTEITYKENYDEIDGIAADVLFDFINAVDTDYFLDNFAYDEKSDWINIHIDPNLYWTFSDKQLVFFGERQHCFDGEEINHVFSSEGMTGKYYESVISAGGESVSCCSVYIPR